MKLLVGVQKMRGHQDLIRACSPILEYINSYGIIETYDDNNIIVSYKLLEQDYKLNEDLVYITTLDGPIVKSFQENQYLGFIMDETKSFFQKQFGADCGFYFVEKLNNSKNHRIYFFTSYYPIIYEVVVNNLELAHEFISLFKNNNKHIVDLFKTIKADFNNKQKQYFKVPHDLRCYSSKEQLLAILKVINVLNENAELSEEEWQFINTYNYGETHSVDIQHIFNMQKDEIKNRFNEIKNKLLK